MDPVTILGAVGSVVGIAAFGLHLAQFLDKFIDDYSSADESLVAILEGIASTNDALGQVRDFLQIEEKNVMSGGAPQLFSLKALKQIRSTSDKCLKVFWRVEAVILRKNPTDEEIKAKLVRFHLEVQEKKSPDVLELDKASLKLNRLGRWRWSFNVGQKLETYNRQLDRQQSTLILMFQVISLQISLKDSHRSAPRKIRLLYEQIPQTALHLTLPEAKRRRQSSYLYPRGGAHPFPAALFDEPPPYHYPPPSSQPIRVQPRRRSRYRSLTPDEIVTVRGEFLRRRSASSSPDRGRTKPRYHHMNHKRRHSHSGDEREEVRRARDEGAEEFSSNDKATKETMDQRIKASEELISIDRARAGRKDSKTVDFQIPKPEAKPEQESGRPRFTQSPTRINDDEVDSIFPQRGSTLGSVSVKATSGGRRRPVQYQKPSVSDQPIESPTEEKSSAAPGTGSRKQTAGYDFEPASEYTATQAQGLRSQNTEVTDPVPPPNKGQEPRESNQKVDGLVDTIGTKVQSAEEVDELKLTSPVLSVIDVPQDEVKVPFIMGWKDDTKNADNSHLVPEAIDSKAPITVVDSGTKSAGALPCLTEGSGAPKPMISSQPQEEPVIQVIAGPPTTQSSPQPLAEPDERGEIITKKNKRGEMKVIPAEEATKWGIKTNDTFDFGLGTGSANGGLSTWGTSWESSSFASPWKSPSWALNNIEDKGKEMGKVAAETSIEPQPMPEPVRICHLVSEEAVNGANRKEMNENRKADLNGESDSQHISYVSDTGIEIVGENEDDKWNQRTQPTRAKKASIGEDDANQVYDRYSGLSMDKTMNVSSGASFSNASARMNSVLDQLLKHGSLPEPEPVADAIINERAFEIVSRPDDSINSTNPSYIDRPNVMDFLEPESEPTEDVNKTEALMSSHIGSMSSAPKIKTKKTKKKSNVVPETTKTNASFINTGGSVKATLEASLDTDNMLSKHGLSGRLGVVDDEMGASRRNREPSTRTKKPSSSRKTALTTGDAGDRAGKFLSTHDNVNEEVATVAPEPRSSMSRRKSKPAESKTSTSFLMASRKPWYKRIAVASSLASESDERNVIEGTEDSIKDGSSYTRTTPSSIFSRPPKKRLGLARALMSLKGSRHQSHRGYITAFVIKGTEHHQVPYSGSFNLGGPRIKWDKGSEWWKQYAFLASAELATLKELLQDTEEYEKQLVHLKHLEKGKLQFWLATERVLVAIISNEPLEKSLDSFDGPRGIGTKAERHSTLSKAASGAMEAKEEGTKDLSSSLGVTNHSKDFPTDANMDETSKHEFILYAAYTIRVFDAHNLYGDPATVKPSCKKEGFYEIDVMKRISELNMKGPDLISKKLNLLAAQNEEIEKLLADLNAVERKKGYTWNLAQIDLHEGPAQGLRSLTLYMKKMSLIVGRNTHTEHPIVAPLPVSPPHESTTAKLGLSKEVPASIIRPSVTFENHATSSRGPDTKEQEKGKSKEKAHQPSQRIPSFGENIPRPVSPGMADDEMPYPYPQPQGPGYNFQQAAPQYPDYPPYGYQGGMYPYGSVPASAPHPQSFSAPGGYISQPYGHQPSYYGYPYGGYNPPSASTSYWPPPPSAPEAPPNDRNPFLPRTPAPAPPPAPAPASAHAPVTSMSYQPAEQPREARGREPSRYQDDESRFITERRHSYYGSAPTLPTVPSHYSTVGERDVPIPLYRPRIPYPEYYDGRSYNPNDLSIGEETGKDIVHKLLKDWTPAGEEEKGKGKGKEKEKVDSESDRDNKRKQEEEDDSDSDDDSDSTYEYGGVKIRAPARSVSMREKEHLGPRRGDSYSASPYQTRHSYASPEAYDRRPQPPPIPPPIVRYHGKKFGNDVEGSERDLERGKGGVAGSERERRPQVGGMSNRKGEERGREIKMDHYTPKDRSKSYRYPPTSTATTPAPKASFMEDDDNSYPSELDEFGRSSLGPPPTARENKDMKKKREEMRKVRELLTAGGGERV